MIELYEGLSIDEDKISSVRVGEYGQTLVTMDNRITHEVDKKKDAVMKEIEAAKKKKS
jgi:hypothetical protein